MICLSSRAKRAEHLLELERELSKKEFERNGRLVKSNEAIREEAATMRLELDKLRRQLSRSEDRETKLNLELGRSREAREGMAKLLVDVRNVIEPLRNEAQLAWAFLSENSDHGSLAKAHAVGLGAALDKADEALNN